MQDDRNDKLNLLSRLPKISHLSIFLMTLITVVFLIGPLLNYNLGSWNTGPISSSHKMLEQQCQTCHSSPLNKVNDRDCLNCHSLTNHSESLTDLVAAHPNQNLPCTSCHLEHKGDHGLIVENSTLCASCHANLKSLVPETKLKNVISFESHPEFSLPIEDQTPIKLNHSAHLRRGLNGPNGPVNMQCQDCHSFKENFREIRPLSFENNCRSCHSLGFDERISNAQVPHAEPDTVYNFLYAEYAKIALQGNSENTNSETRLRPGEKVQSSPKLEFAKEQIVDLARKAEKMLFEETACQLCHQVTAIDSPSVERSYYKITKAQISQRWMKKARFNHGAHQELKCDSCHKNARESSKTTDVLLPKIQDCRPCHSQEDVAGSVKSDCVECHSYHDQVPMNEEKKQTIEEILYSLNKK